MLFDQGSHFRLTSNGLSESTLLRRGGLAEGTVARWLGILPALLRPGARELLVVGLGGGMALEAIPSAVESIEVIELEPEVLEANQRVGAERAIDPLADPRVRVVIGDARGALQLTARRYDAIVSQPSHPWTAAASHLYTREFFSLARSRLAPDGIFVQWIGLAFVDEALLRSLLATLLEVFAHVEAYQPEAGGLLFAASDAALGLAGVGDALRAAPQDYARFGIHRIEDVAAARVLGEAGARALAEGALVNTDDHNRLASRASRLGNAALDPESAQALMRDFDPLPAESAGLDRPALIRILMARGFAERARSLARSSTGADEEVALGWIELERGRRGRAARHFARALELDPDARDARAGLAASRLAALVQGVTLPALDGRDPGAHLSAVIAGLRRARERDWHALAALDAQLAGSAPGESLFEESSLLRIEWRLEAGDPAAGAEALALAETLLLRRPHPETELLRASAALAAQEPLAARASLERIARLPAPQARAYAARALEIAERLPDEVAGDLRSRLAARAGRAQEPAQSATSPGLNPAAAAGKERTPR
jgi:hypothetical protein